MKAFFTASLQGKKTHERYYNAIISCLKSRKITVVVDKILAATKEESENKLQKESRKFHEQIEKEINACDFMVAEATIPSHTVGYEISLAHRSGKPVLILYSEDHAPTFTNYPTDEKIVSERYTEHSLCSLMDDFINYVKGIHDTRFTFFITPEIAAHLEDIARTKKKPKSVYLRELIEEKMLESR